MISVKKENRTRKFNGGRPRISEAKKDTVVQMYNDDYTVKQICEACEISTTSLYRIIKERSEKDAAI